MYVNELTQDYGDEGRQAVRELLRRGEAIGASRSPSGSTSSREGWPAARGLEMRAALRALRRPTASGQRPARICSHECTFCSRVRRELATICPNCGGELVLRPRRAAWPGVVLSAVRTPVGRYGGALAGVRPDDLAAVAIAAAVERAGVDRGEIEDVYLGCANQAGEDNRNVARMAALLAGLPESVAGVTRQPALRVRALGRRRRLPRGRAPATATSSSPAASSR